VGEVSDIDPYGLPRFTGEEYLLGWVDHSDIATRNVRVFTSGSLTVTLIQHVALWDVIVSDGAGGVWFSVFRTDTIAAAMDVIRETRQGIAGTW
jgi:hypothetical protein